MPLRRYTAQWREQGSSGGEEQAAWAASQAGLQRLLTYVQERADLRARYDVQAWAADLAAGAWICSDIPQGYGVGSSGSVVAAVYERYAHKPQQHIDALQRELAQLENCFHAASSGLDPLVIYAEKAVHLAQGAAQFVENLPPACLRTYLIDTGASRSTAPLVAHYRQLAAQTVFQEQYLPQYLRLSAACLRAWLAADAAETWAQLCELSAWQYEHLQAMIPAAASALWREGLQSQQFALKLCGAGGGGFLLAFARPDEAGLPASMSAAMQIF